MRLHFNLNTPLITAAVHGKIPKDDMKPLAVTGNQGFSVNLGPGLVSDALFIEILNGWYLRCPLFKLGMMRIVQASLIDWFYLDSQLKVATIIHHEANANT